jgi:putative phosphoesterase
MKPNGGIMSVKIAALSDIHGNATALNYVIKDMEKQGINKVIILGDVVMKGPSPAEVMNELKKLDILGWIKGNTDVWFEEIGENDEPKTDKEKKLYSFYSYARKKMNKEDIEFINNLPVEYSLTYNGIKILCVHGTPKSIVEAIDNSVPVEEIKEAIKDVKEDVILCGHSHCSFIGEIDGKKIFNAGSIGNPFDNDNRASYGILDFSNENVELINRRVSYPINELLVIAAKNNFPYLDEYKLIMESARMI